MVAQVDEQHAAMVAHAVAPAGQPDFLTRERLVGLSTGVRTVAMHGALSVFDLWGMPEATGDCAPRSALA